MWESAVLDGPAYRKKKAASLTGGGKKNEGIAARLRGALPGAPSLLDQIS